MSVESGEQEWPSRVLTGLQEAIADMIAEPDLQAVLDKAVERTAELVNADIATIHILDRLTGGVRAAAGYGVSDWKTFRQHKPGRGKVGLLVAHRDKPVIAEDVSSSALAGPFATREGVQSAAGFPLKVAGEVVGVLFVSYRKPHKFEPKEIETLASFANLAVLAMEKARLLDDAQRRVRDLEVINRVAEIMGNKLETDELLQALVDEIAKELHCTHCAFFMPSEPTNEDEILLGPQVFRDTREGRLLDRSFRIGEGLTGWVFETGRSVRLADARQDKRFAPSREPTEAPLSMLVVPVKAGDRVIGVISADQDARDWFSQSDQRLVEALARHAGIAVERATGLQLLQNIGKRIVGRYDVKDILQRIVHGALQIVGASAGVIYLISEDGLSVVQSFEYPHGFDHPAPRMAGNGGITRQILQNGQMMIFPDIREDPLVNPLMRDRVRSMSGIPLKLEQGVIGVLYLNHAEQHAYTETEISLLQMLSDQAAIAIHEARLLGDLNRQVRGHRTLNEVGSSLAGMLDEKEILQHVARSAADTLKCTHCSVFLVEMDKLIVGAVEGTRRQSLQPGRTFDLGQGVAGWVALAGESALVPNTQEDPRFDPGWSELQCDPQSLVVVPILLGEEVYGVISAEEDRRNAFDKHDLTLLGTLASQASQAIRNAKRQKALDDLNRATQALLAVRNPDRLLQSIAVESQKVLDADIVVLYEYFEAQQDVAIPPTVIGDLRYESIVKDRGKAHPHKDSAVFRMILRDEPYYAKHAAQDWAHLDVAYYSDDSQDNFVLRESIISSAGFPLLSGGERLGVIFANYRNRQTFSPDMRNVMELFAGAAALAIRQARSYAQRLDDIVALEEINKAILDKGLEHTTQLIAEKAMTLSGATYATLRLVDDSGEYLELKAVRGRDTKEGRLPIDENSFTGWVAMSGEAALCPDVKEDDHYVAWYSDVRSCMAAPLKRHGQVIGTLYVESLRLGGFSEQYQLDLLQALANQAAIAIENARVYEQRTKDIAALQEINEAVVSKALHKILQLVVDRAVEVMPGEYAELWLLESATGDLVLQTVAGPDLARQAALSTGRLKAGEASTNMRVAITSERYIWKGEEEDPSFRRIYEAARSAVIVPLKYQDEIVGTLNVESAELGVFTEQHGQLLDSFADQAAIAIENANLFNQLDRRVGELEVLTEMSRGAVSDLGINQILDLVYKEMGRVIDLSDAQVQFAFYDEAKDEVSFPLAVEQDDGEIIDMVQWGKRKPQYRKPNEDEAVEHFQPRARRKPPGLNEHVIRTKEPLLIVENFEKEAKAKGIQVWPTFGRLERPTESWLGVPMMVGGRVTGVISIQSLEQEHAYDQDHVRVLTAIANQAAVAIENIRLFEETDERATQLLKLQDVTATISGGPRELDGVLTLVVQSLQEIFPEASCGLRLYHSQKDEFSPQMATGPLKDLLPHTPRAGGTSQYIIETKAPRYLEGDELRNPPDGGPAIDGVILQRGVKAAAYLPLLREQDVIGILYVDFFVPHRFSENDKQILELFTDQAAIAIQNSRLYRDLERRIEELGRRNQELEVLTEIGRTVSNLGIDQILDLVYEEMGKIIDLRDAQVQFAFYDEKRDEVSFPLAVEQDKERGGIIDRVRWGVREPEYREPDEDETVEQFRPRARREPPGLNEYVIRTKEPLLIVENFEQEAEEKGIRFWPTFGRLDRPTESWLGVPMMVGGRVTGVISIQSLAQEHAFDQGHVQVLGAVANQAAVAIENAWLYANMEQMVAERTQAWQEERERADAAEKLALMSEVAAEFAHRMNNLAGTIPVRVAMAKEKLNPGNDRDARVIRQLDSIAADTKLLLDAAQEIRRSTEARAAEYVDVNEVLTIALSRVQNSKPDMEGRIQVDLRLADDLPQIWVERNKLLDSLVSIIQNGAEAMPEEGTLTLATRRGNLGDRSCIEIIVADTGVGIPAEHLPDIFHLFFTAKEKGLGFGLWRDRTFIKGLGGDIEVQSAVDKGTTFAIKIPASSGAGQVEEGQHD
jgi:GAF domain-containing protein